VIKIFYGDCLKLLKSIENDCVDAVIVDLPYGTSQNKWDIIIPFDPLWKEFYRIGKNDCPFIFTATQPFTSMLVSSNIRDFRYEIIWEKTIGSGQLNIKRQPLRVHESILVFYRKQPTYNEQKTKGSPYKISRKALKEQGYGKQRENKKENDGYRHARSVIRVSNPRIKNGHPTQKPLELMKYIVRTYTNEGDMVLDCCMGSGTTGKACKELNRDFMGIENDKEWYYRCLSSLIDLKKPSK